MLSFKEFLTEKEHEDYGRDNGVYTHDWGIIHPHTGQLISGKKHSSAVNHSSLIHALSKKHNIPKDHFARYIHEKPSKLAGTTSSTVHTDSDTHESHTALLKGIKNLPIASTYTHNDRSGSSDHADTKSLYNHVKKLTNL